MADPLIDSVVAQYQILSRLGGGAMGVVYKARDLKLGRHVALKFLPPEWSHDEDAKQRFVREAQAASSTDHANICTVHDIQSTDDGRLFIVMAFYDGQTLKQKLAQGPLAIGEALAIATQVADGLARAHAAGVVHRDVKPGNVIVTADTVKIVDFGLATLAGSVQLTQAGSPMGTVGYMAPEQLRGLGAMPQSDVWAVGVMLYEMLAGHPPFQGAYAEALSYAIRHDTPPPLRTVRPEIPEEVEQLVFRALHKDAGVRFASGRELARALRQVQGHTVPLELQTAAVDASRLQAARARIVRSRRWRALAVGALVLAAAGGLGVWYVSRPPIRTFVAVVPVVNGTGDRTLDSYRLALTLELTRELAESRNVRVFSYTRLLTPLRKFLAGGTDPSGTAAAQAVAGASRADVVLRPSLVYDQGALKARAELQDANGSALGRVETAPIVSSLVKDAAATLIGSLAVAVDERLRGRGWTLGGGGARPLRFASLDAAQAFEAGLNAYDLGEYAAARDAFAAAAKEDPRHPLPVAWQSRVANLTGDRVTAAQAADLAEARLQGASPEDTAFVSGVIAEARRQDEGADRDYGAFAAARRPDTSGLIELAGFRDRSGRTAEAIASYRQAADLDPPAGLPALELCRLYTRTNESAQARQFGERALKAFAAVGSAPGEATALLCLVDNLRRGTPDERARARKYATRALMIFESLNLRYGLARAQHYLAMTADAQNDFAAAAASWEQALVNAKAVGNTGLEATVYINLGVTYLRLGQRGKAVEYYTLSYQTAERRGDERRAAYSRANAGAVLIEYGDRSDDGLRFIEAAMRVVRNLEDKTFEVFCLQLMAAHARFAGRYDQALDGVRKAMALARERKLEERFPALLLDEARVLMETGRYVEARDKLDEAMASQVAQDLSEVLIERARVDARLGDIEHGRQMLDRARQLPESMAGDMLPRWHAATGEVAYAAGDLKQAYLSFAEAARLWTDDLPHAASVEARAYTGWVDGSAGKASGRPAVEASLAEARRMKRPLLEAVARVYLARLDLQAGQPDKARALLDAVRLDAIGPELQAQVHYGRAAAAASLGNDAAAQQGRREVARILAGLQKNVPESLRPRFLLRPDVRALSQ
jgi:tetratricopeptide (TPR) repeat protein/tRNA A-37 threonylcarbamoyl transferase component Bud32